jgi:hypothetical protein
LAVGGRHHFHRLRLPGHDDQLGLVDEHQGHRRPIVRYPVNHVNAYPMSTTNTTYMVTSKQHPATYYPTANQQTVYQAPVVTYPSNNTNNGVIYQTTSPGYPPVNNQQQQQPVYYTQSNPPTYSATANN